MSEFPSRPTATGNYKSVLVRLSIGILFVLTSACQSTRAASPPEEITIQTTQVKAQNISQPEITDEPQDSPTPVLLQIEDTPQIQGEIQTQPATPVSDPLRFVFPTPQPAPVSAWRPPLYPTPWAPTPYDHFYFARPIAANEINWPLADYRYGGVFFDNVVHTGVDIPAPRGTPVLAAGPGRVTWAG